MDFFGISQELADTIWEKALEYYFDDRDASALREAEAKIKIVGCVRFLQVLLLMGIGREDLKQRRVEHTLEHLRALAWKVDSLEIGT